MYDHTKQYRCTIIRGKSQNEMDNLLPVYAMVVDDVCPCSISEFDTNFDSALKRFMPSANEKTLKNHRTEIAGKMFGMYYAASDGIVYESERTSKFLEEDDQPAFFKDICYKHQFPNGSQKVATTVRERVNDKINIRPFAFTLRLLQLAMASKVDITKKQIGYYVFNALDVLQGNATPDEVLSAIKDDESKGIIRKISYPGKEDSFCYQHINEQLNLLEMANLIRFTEDKRIILNMKEADVIEDFASEWNKPPMFNVYAYDLDSTSGRSEFQLDWDKYYSEVSPIADRFVTKPEALIDVTSKDDKSSVKKSEKHRTNTTEFGDKGEEIVYNYEKDRVAAYNARLINKVIAMGKTKGLGYDIQSVVAEDGPEAEFVKYIEVKSTKRYTAPDQNDSIWMDTLNITRNEYVAAIQHKEYYSIFRVYFTHEGIVAFVLKNPGESIKSGRLSAVPTMYRIDFNGSHIDEVIHLKRDTEEIA